MGCWQWGVIRTILTNNGIPRTVTFSSDGSTIAAGFIDGSLHLYDSFIGVELMPLYGHIGSILDAEWSPDALNCYLWSRQNCQNMGH